MDLFNLGKKHNSVKCYGRFEYGWHFCKDVYPFHFEAVRFTVRNLLEIGVAKGGSLRMWEEYFPSATIYGIDIDPIMSSDGRISFRHGSQSDREFLRSVNDEVDGWDIVIDDGSHRNQDQILSYEILWPHVRPGGFYAIEDIVYRHRKSLACIDYFNKKVKDEFTKNSVTTDIKKIVFYPAIIILEKNEAK